MVNGGGRMGGSAFARGGGGCATSSDGRKAQGGVATAQFWTLLASDPARPVDRNSAIEPFSVDVKSQRWRGVPNTSMRTQYFPACDRKSTLPGRFSATHTANSSADLALTIVRSTRVSASPAGVVAQPARASGARMQSLFITVAYNENLVIGTV